MKSWFRRLANSFSRKPEAAAETTWHAEDFRGAPDRPTVADPWALDGAPTNLRERPADPPPALDTAPLTRATPTEDLAPPLTAELPWSATSLTRTEPEGAQPPADAPPDAIGADDNATTLAHDAPYGVIAAASHTKAVAPREHETGLAPSAPEGELCWDDVSPAAAIRDEEAPQSRHGAGTSAPNAEVDDIDPPDARWADKVPQAASDAEFAVEDVAPPASGASVTGISDADWDDFAPDPAPPPPVSASGHDDDFDLPEYDPGLSQRLGDAEWAAKAPRNSLARQRAGMIAALLDVTSRHEAEAALNWLEAFFLEHRWSATFRALETAALEGLDFLTLRAMAALKDIWAERPDWWLRRIRTNRATLGGTPTERLPRGDTALSWRLARRICLARCDFPPEEMIDPDWLTEWYSLLSDEPGAGFFITFLDEKVTTMLAEALNEGLAAKASADEPLSQGRHYLAPRRPLLCGPDGELVSPVMVEATGQRQRSTEDDG